MFVLVFVEPSKGAHSICCNGPCKCGAAISMLAVKNTAETLVLTNEQTEHTGLN